MGYITDEDHLSAIASVNQRKNTDSCRQYVIPLMVFQFGLFDSSMLNNIPNVILLQGCFNRDAISRNLLKE